MLEQLFELGKQLVETLGYPGIVIGIFLETVIPPIPAEAVIGFAGFLIFEGKLSWVLTIFAATLGNFFGVSLFWYLGKRFGKKTVIKYGSWLDITEESFEKTEKLFAKYGYYIVFFSQFIPQMRTLIAIPAGALRTTYWKFILANQLGATIWFSFILYVAFTLGSNWSKVAQIVEPYDTIIISLVSIIVALVVGYKLFKIIDKKFLTNRKN